MKLVRFPLASLLALLLFGALAPPAHAQPMGKTLVVPFLAAQAKPVPFSAGRTLPADETRQIEAALGRQHVPLLSLHEAHDRFLAHSRLAQQPGATDIDELGKEAQAAIQHVALGKTNAAQQSVQRIITLAERSLETLNRETATARGLLDACLALVRASLHENKRDEAIDQAMRCRRLVPDLAPSDVAHPASVVGALAEADDQLRRMRVGSLRVAAEPERGCEVFLNGRHLGHTPFTLERAPSGAYRVQVECAGDPPGRVHWIDLGDDPVALTVSASFDAAVQTEPRLTLRYPSEEAARAGLVAHAAQLGRETRADDVVLVGRLGGKLLLLRILAQQGSMVAGAQLSDTLPATYKSAAETLTQSRFDRVEPASFPARPALAPALASATPAAAATPATEAVVAKPSINGPPAKKPASPPPVVAPSSRALLISGGVLAGVGAAGLGASYGLFAHTLKLRDEASKGTPGSEAQQDAQAEYENWRLSPVLVGITASALATASVPMLLPKHPPRSKGGWIGGAVAGAAGVALFALAGVYGKEEPTLSGLLAVTALPLLTIPITQVVRLIRAKHERVPMEPTPMYPTRAPEPMR